MGVCGKFKGPVLEWEQAWVLFQQKVGQGDLNSRTEIVDLSKGVAEECVGLPLALITAGSAMAAKKSAEEWIHAVQMLERYDIEFPEIKKQVLSSLRFSYESLDAEARKCFLYFSLYPEDHAIKIEEIVYYWIGEGFFDKSEDMDVAVTLHHWKS